MENVFDTRKKKPMIYTAICTLLVLANALIIVSTIGRETSLKLLQTTTESVHTTTEGLSQWKVILRLKFNVCVFYIYFVVKIICYPVTSMFIWITKLNLNFLKVKC